MIVWVLSKKAKWWWWCFCLWGCYFCFSKESLKTVKLCILMFMISSRWFLSFLNISLANWHKIQVVLIINTQWNLLHPKGANNNNKRHSQHQVLMVFFFCVFGVAGYSICSFFSIITSLHDDHCSFKCF